MLIVLILVPSVVLAVVVVGILDRLGVLPRFDGGPTTATYGSWYERVPRAVVYAACGVMVAWILAWVVFFFVGVRVLRS